MSVRLGVALVLVASLAARASADPPEVAIGVNPPLQWRGARAVGVSGYVGVSAHQAIRASFATREYDRSFLDSVGNVISRTSDGSYWGRTNDASVAWMYFPRRLWSGPLLEAGMLWRGRDNHMRNITQRPELVDTETSTYAGRALAGWSWLIAGHVFISVAAGVAVGYEVGTETTAPHYEDIPVMLTTTDVGRRDVSAEGFIRLGGAFGL